VTVSEGLGLAATGLVIAGYVPQIGHLIKERCTAGISVPAFLVWCVASGLFLVHAALIDDPVFVAAQSVNLAAGAIIVTFCRRYQGHRCPFHGGSVSRRQRGRRRDRHAWRPTH
jgi:uncharacterized protein with PQ loop repeat